MLTVTFHRRIHGGAGKRPQEFLDRDGDTNVASHVLLSTKQDAQLSQRDRAAGCVIVFAKSRTLELGDNILRTV